MMSKLAIAYRIYPRVSKKPPVFSDNKYELSKLCLKSFSNALKGIDYKIWILLDGCPPEYKILFESVLDTERMEFIDLEGIGNLQTFDLQMKTLLEQDFSENIYFAEDDYFYLEHAFNEMLGFMSANNDVHFISPYDHLDYYMMEFHNYESKIKVSEQNHWRTASCTCMTFLTTKQTLIETKKAFDTYMVHRYDASLWMAITKKTLYDFRRILFFKKNDPYIYDIYRAAWKKSFGTIFKTPKRNLWIPVPSLATHMESAFIAPIINWDNQFKSST